MKIVAGIQSLERVFPRNLRGSAIGVTDGRTLSRASLKWDEVASFVKIGSAI
jgi:hypothetical protein